MLKMNRCYSIHSAYQQLAAQAARDEQISFLPSHAQLVILAKVEVVEDLQLILIWTRWPAEGLRRAARQPPL